ncbi:unnamed protein product [Adineta steineri]|uniref:Superoxide dismutase [Cu-Zn] n=1 Tax=Adineta steineri TaxID=433720 RepID=A0A814ZXH1_9BILA|nr:unnamed protein product [Adineta steineri]CAF1324987.1 unnamed protein product [Adineta steineri]CAF3644176.1 unnamed protein product [Adineta steineri]CAF3880244.1 unnamed protein product [Adineta steineri]
MAYAKIYLDSSNTVAGHLTFMQSESHLPVVIKGQISNMTANTVHGFHVHQNPLGNGEFNCTAAGPHFNPYNTTHGPITANIMHRHVGDLGNVTSDSAGNINIDIHDSIIQLYNNIQSIVNRTIVLHAMRDDGGMGGFTDSKTTGNAGARIACGNIELNPM